MARRLDPAPASAWRTGAIGSQAPKETIGEEDWGQLEDFGAKGQAGESGEGVNRLSAGAVYFRHGLQRSNCLAKPDAV